MEDWRNFVRTVATRYKGRIRKWEIWNEPNRPQSWTGTVDQMVDLTREAYTILKSVDPGNTVVSPAPTGTYGLKFFDAFLGKGGGRFADAIGYHFYVDKDAPPEAMIALISSVRSTMEKYGLSAKPQWNTEAGWLGPDLLPPDTQAAYLARAFILNWSAGVERFYWYAWENHHGTEIELVGRDNATLTPAGTALATLETWMTGAVLSRCSASPKNIWTCDLERGNQSSHILWSAGGETALPLPAAWHAKERVSLDGTTQAVQGSSISIGIAPALVL
jgi:hypothetical protein